MIIIAYIVIAIAALVMVILATYRVATSSIHPFWVQPSSSTVSISTSENDSAKRMATTKTANLSKRRSIPANQQTLISVRMPVVQQKTLNKNRERILIYQRVSK